MSTAKRKEKEKPNAWPVTVILIVHAFFLAGCGTYPAAKKNWVPAVMHSAYAGCGSALFLLLCAGATASSSYKLYMIGAHFALLLQLIFSVVFALQAYRSYGIPEKADRHVLFVLMGIGSLAALIGMLVFKPKAKKAQD